MLTDDSRTPATILEEWHSAEREFVDAAEGSPDYDALAARVLELAQAHQDASRDVAATGTRAGHDAQGVPVRRSDPEHPEVVGAQHGFGHTALGRVAKGRGTAFGDLNTVRYDPLSGQASHKEICVRVRKA